MRHTPHALSLVVAALALGPSSAQAGNVVVGPVADAGVGAGVDGGVAVEAGAAPGVDPVASATTESTVSVDAGTEPPPSRGSESNDPDRKDVKWIKRWAPEPHMTELGLFLGGLVVGNDHELYQVHYALPDRGWREIGRVTFDLGARVGYYPIRHFGFEGELAWLPVAVPDTEGSAFGYSGRVSVIAQLGLASVTPFISVGAGAIGVSSRRSVLGDNRDGVVHVGGGLKFFVNRRFAMRAEVRNNFAPKFGIDGVANHQEFLLGFNMTLGRDKNEVDIETPTVKDTDGDGWFDGEDECLVIPGVPEHRGCPIPDTDGDGIVDPEDKCPKQTGTAEYEGCPVPDTDGDRFFDDEDQCIDDPGIEPDGCPIRDTDGDGFMDDVDECVDEPETVNEYEDEDGCPDEVPDEISRFSGIIDGVHFETNKAAIKPDSKKVLDEAVEVLNKYDLRVEISGHTDSKGKESWNMKLSDLRAQAVRDYMVAKGVDSVQLETIGWGPYKPIETNDTSEGRAKNRRIEFRLLDVDQHTLSTSDRDDEVRRLKE